ncbi:hypothetical protein N7497_004923 [Penicillium chrysogenum]|uniref:Uncharacterized protein n=1 Tax=Penicillium chrysogenum TaxID=5076 RepID=A0ABQ8WPL3_PENCH|nr:hypothetical protein N7505_002868 [Penicillium chrysogenum]KAJ6156038.1 hypothetical protein N7497_004923 [Penicillium chrysogenum]
MAVTPATPEDAAREILRCLQSIAGFQQIRLLVTGELAVRRYFPSHPVQQKEKVEFLVFLGDGFDHRVDELPSGVSDLLKLKLLSMHPESFQKRLGFLEFKSRPVLFIPKEILPYVPQGTPTIAENSIGDLPYTTATDTLIYMVMSDSLRLGRQPPGQDVRAVTNFVRHLRSQGPINFSPQQEECLASHLHWLASSGFWDGERWRQRLGLP